MENTSLQPLRGQIYYCDLGKSGGSIQNGKRPVIVLQSRSVGDRSPTVVVAPITSVLKKTEYHGHVLLPEIEGLPKHSMVLLEQMRTVNVSDLGNFCCRVKNSITMLKIDVAIKQTLGIYGQKKDTKKHANPLKITTCLCYKCVNYYRDNPKYKVRRLTPRNGSKDKCDRCGSPSGYDFQITKRLERNSYGKRT